jgi:long-chain fatty acid transport protein
MNAHRNESSGTVWSRTAGMGAPVAATFRRRLPIGVSSESIEMTTRCRCLGLLAIALLCGEPGLTLANGLRLVSQDAFATARGEAFVATADNASAIYYNPAGLTQLSGLQSRSGIYGLYFDTTYQPPGDAPNAGRTYDLEHNLAAIPQFFSAYAPTNQPLAFGFGIYSPFGGRVLWPQDTGFRTVGYEGSVTYVALNPVVAWQVNPKLSIGAGLTVNYAKLDLEQGLLRNQTPFANFFQFVGEGWAVGYNLGVLWQPYEKLSFGANFRSTTSLTAEGHTEFEQQPVIQRTGRDASADYEFPLTVVLGVSYRPTPQWNLEFNADYTDWSSFDSTTSLQETAPPFPIQQDIDVKLGWQASWLYEFGVTRYLQNGWQVSGGYVFSENSVPDTYYSPVAADLDRHVFSLGTGYRGAKFGFDVAYQFAFGPPRTVSGSTPSAQPAQFAGQTADGKYDFISHGLLVSLSMRF